MTVRGFSIVGLLLTSLAAMGAKYETPNFSVTASSDKIARQVGLAAEEHRRQLAEDWLGTELPRWSQRCRLTVRSQAGSPNGYTSFVFTDREVQDWQMTVEGNLDEILESVLPHEISHTVFASHFRRPVPRWADEGASLLAECETERLRQHEFTSQLLRNSRSIPLRKLMTLKQYPAERQQMLALYAQGHSVAEYLVESAGRTRYIAFLETSDRLGWDNALRRHYGFPNIEALEVRFTEWLEEDRPIVSIPQGQLLVSGIFAEKNASQFAVSTELASNPLDVK